MPGKPFKALFCERFNCSPVEFEERALRKCLYWHARILAVLLRPLTPELFAEDLKFIRSLGLADDGWQVAVDASIFHDENQWNGGFLRTQLRLRVSGRKATRLARELFAQARQGEPRRTVLPLREDLRPGLR